MLLSQNLYYGKDFTEVLGLGFKGGFVKKHFLIM